MALLARQRGRINREGAYLWIQATEVWQPPPLLHVVRLRQPRRRWRLNHICAPDGGVCAQVSPKLYVELSCRRGIAPLWVWELRRGGPSKARRKLWPEKIWLTHGSCSIHLCYSDKRHIILPAVATSPATGKAARTVPSALTLREREHLRQMASLMCTAANRPLQWW